MARKEPFDQSLIVDSDGSISRILARSSYAGEALQEELPAPALAGSLLLAWISLLSNIAACLSSSDSPGNRRDMEQSIALLTNVCTP